MEPLTSSLSIPPKISEEEMRALDEDLPRLAAEAGARAYREALAAGSTVLVGDDDGVIYRVHPDGSREMVKSVPGSTTITLGPKVVPLWGQRPQQG